jgi:4-amino-4-deoxy-L-arabinose transferase-like glycosyltransferase
MTEINVRTGRPARDPQFRITLWVLAGVTGLRLMWLAGQPIDLYPDEAQYWVWAQHLAWGYYSKPPFVAWLIAATTAMAGDGELGVKLGAPLAYFFTSLMVYGIGARLYDRHVGGWAAISFVTLPAVSVSAVIISTDVPLLFFWGLATYGFIRARAEDGGWRWWLLVGLAGGFGLLSKYAMGFWLLSALIYLVFCPEERRHLTRFLLATVLSILIYLPNLAWNAAHRFVSYRHTEANANLHGISFHGRPFLDFAVAQFGVFGPIFLAVLILILLGGRKAFADRRQALLLAFSLPTLAIMLIEASLSRAQPNWSAPVYLSATVLVVAWLHGKAKDGWVQWSVVLHVALAILVFGVADAAKAVGHPLPGKLDPLHRLKGWQRLGQSLSAIRWQAGGLPVLSDQRELMAALSYYMEPHPLDMKAWNPQGDVENGFELDNSLADRPGGDYLLLTDRTDELTLIEARFQHHTTVAHVIVPIGRGLQREVSAIALYGFKGYRDPAPAAPAAGSATSSAPPQ